MVYKSPWPNQAPYAPMTLPQLLEQTVNRLPDKTAFISAEGQTWTFAEYWAAAKKMARALQDRGIKKGDTIGIYAPNSVEYAVVLHGALIAGATVTTLNPLYKEREVEHQLGDAGAKAAFTLSALVPVVKDAQNQLPKLKDIFELEQVRDMVKTAGDPAPVEYDADTTIAVLPFSSGTTGCPRA